MKIFADASKVGTKILVEEKNGFGISFFSVKRENFPYALNSLFGSQFLIILHNHIPSQGEALKYTIGAK